MCPSLIKEILGQFTYAYHESPKSIAILYSPRPFSAPNVFELVDLLLSARFRYEFLRTVTCADESADIQQRLEGREEKKERQGRDKGHGASDGAKQSDGITV